MLSNLCPVHCMHVIYKKLKTLNVKWQAYIPKVCKQVKDDIKVKVNVQCTLGVADGMTCSQPAGQHLSVDDLVVLLEELVSVCAKWYNIGMKLGVGVGRLDAIRTQYNDPSNCLRETLATWLRARPTSTTWSKVVEALNSATVNEGTLATSLQHKYCSSTPPDTTTPSHPQHHPPTLTGI